MASEPSEVPPGMQRIYQRFVRWRGAHPGVRLPIPPRLWKASAKVAREHGVCRTAQVLRLEYGKLKRMAESYGVPASLDPHKGRRGRRSAAAPHAVTGASITKASRARSAAASVPSFLEVVGSSTIAASECVIASSLIRRSIADHRGISRRRLPAV